MSPRRPQLFKNVTHSTHLSYRLENVGGGWRDHNKCHDGMQRDLLSGPLVGKDSILNCSNCKNVCICGLVLSVNVRVLMRPGFLYLTLPSLASTHLFPSRFWAFDSHVRNVLRWICARRASSSALTCHDQATPNFTAMR